MKFHALVTLAMLAAAEAQYDTGYGNGYDSDYVIFLSSTLFQQAVFSDPRIQHPQSVLFGTAIHFPWTNLLHAWVQRQRFQLLLFGLTPFFCRAIFIVSQAFHH
ncbi:hypothetical protein PSPO01_09957 [Paraphaeosphaeria sporulosa]